MIVCAALGAAAHLDASGLAALVEETLIEATSPEPRGRREQIVSSGDEEDHTRTAAAILARNPFDSVTGPLDGSVVGLPIALPAPQPAGDPRDDPVCEGGRVTVIASSDDPAWAFAAITDQANRRLLRRTGDDVAGGTVLAVGWDRVWISTPGGRCQLRLGEPPKPVKKPAQASSAAPRVPGRRGVLREIADRVRKISEREIVVDRTAVDLVLAEESDLLRSARMLPVSEGGRVVGYRVLRVRSGSLLDVLGMKTGDQLRSINGLDLTDPQQALEAYSKLRASDELTLALRRDGADTSIAFHLR